MIYDTSSFQDVFTHLIWNSYLKKYKRYAPQSMQFLDTRSEVKIKVIVTQLWYATLRHPTMHQRTKFEIRTSNNIISDMLRTRSSNKRSEDPVFVNPNNFASLNLVLRHIGETAGVRRYGETEREWVIVCCLFIKFDSLRPINNLSVKQGRLFLG